MVLGLLTLGTVSWAERLIFIPTGDRFLGGEVRLQSFFEDGSSSVRRTYLGFGILKLADLEITEEKRHGQDSQVSFDLSFNYNKPFPDISPGLSIGVQDALDRTVDGRGFYVAMTYQFNNFDAANAETPSELTIGGGTGRYRGAFVGAKLPFTNAVRLVAEHDSMRITAGLELEIPRSGFRAMAAVRNQEYFLSGSFSVKF